MTRLPPHGAIRGVALLLLGHLAPRAAALRVQGEAHNQTACADIGPSPFYRHGRYANANFTAEYPLSKEDFEGIPLEGQWGGVVKVMKKLAAGGTVKLVVVGGSFTTGGECFQNEKDLHVSLQSCAWAARLREWLQLAFPQGTVDLRNLAAGGYTTGTVYTGIGALLRSEGLENVDLIFIDTLPNDSYPMGITSGQSFKFGERKEKMDRHHVVSVTYEGLIRAIHKISPDTVIFSVLAGCFMCVRNEYSQLDVINYYDLPRLDYAAFVSQRPVKVLQRLWDNTSSHNDCHPNWRTHQLYADSIASSWGRAYERFCASPDLAPPPLPKRTFWDPSILAIFPVCEQPASYYSAFKAGSPGAAQPVAMNNWSLYEDRPGKPGWITEEDGANITFRVNFGNQAMLSITHLVSYEGMGKAYLSVNVTDGNDIDWIDATDKSQNVSQSVTYTLVSKLKKNTHNKVLDLTITKRGPGKFKISELISC